MYAKAIYKPRDPEIKSLSMLIERDRRDFSTNVPGTEIRELPVLVTTDGKRLPSLAFVPKAMGNWERVSHGEEGEFYLVFTLSSRSRRGYESTMRAYERLIARYSE